MGCLIDQGKRITENAILVDDGVACTITKVKLHPTFQQAIVVTFKALSGKFKGRTFTDTVSYDPNNSMAWKYDRLRQCAGVPYVEGESNKVDIESLLVSKCLKADLSERIDSNGNSWQNVKYAKLSHDELDKLSDTATSDDDSEDWSENEEVKHDGEDLPF